MFPRDATVQVVDPSYDPRSCDGTHTDPLCPVHGTPPWPIAPAFCLGRRFWTCERCNALASGSACRNCGRGASQRIFDPTSESYTDDAMRRVRPQP